MTDRLTCPIGERLTRKKRKDYAKREKGFLPQRVRRQRPCRGNAKPTVTYTERKRKIGRFQISKITSKLSIGGTKGKVKKETDRIAKEAGYDDKKASGEPIKISSEIDGPKTLLERFTALTSGSEMCFYQVYAHEKRRHCTCPDGSKCKSTVRR